MQFTEYYNFTVHSPNRVITMTPELRKELQQPILTQPHCRSSLNSRDMRSKPIKSSPTGKQGPYVALNSEGRSRSRKRYLAKPQSNSNVSYTSKETESKNVQDCAEYEGLLAT